MQAPTFSQKFRQDAFCKPCHPAGQSSSYLYVRLSKLLVHKKDINIIWKGPIANDSFVAILPFYHHCFSTEDTSNDHPALTVLSKGKCKLVRSPKGRNASSKSSSSTCNSLRTGNRRNESETVQCQEVALHPETFVSNQNGG